MKRVIDEPTLIKLRARMVKCALKKKHRNPEDVASEYVLRLLEGLHQKTTVDQAYIDIVRTEANSRSKHYQTQLNLNSNVEDPDLVLSFKEAPPEDLTIDDRIDLERYVTGIKCPKMKHIITSRLMGYTLEEIAQELGVTQSYVQQLVTRQLAY